MMYHHLGNDNVPAMYRASRSCAAVATGTEQELKPTVTLGQDAAAVNVHFDKVTLQLKRANYLHGTVPDGDSDEFGFSGLREIK
jgi:hypothetical protein